MHFTHHKPFDPALLPSGALGFAVAYRQEDSLKTEVAILHHEYPTRIRVYVSEKLQSLARYFDGTVSVRAVLERVHNEHRVELISNVRKGVVLVVDARADSIAGALDEALAKMGRVLARHKDRLKEGTRRRVPE